MDGSTDPASLIANLSSPSESARKFAVFKLQGLLADRDYANDFLAQGGLAPLKSTVMDTTGNTQAYAFGSLDALLELDLGWGAVDRDIVHKAVELAVAHPLVNTVRNVLTLLVLTISKPLEHPREDDTTVVGIRAVKPLLETNPAFIESLVQRLSASDHTLCANALQLVNALMRDSVLNGSEQEWPRFIKRLQDLGVIGSVGMLMRGDAASDPETPLASAILDFQGLTKLLLRKWREMKVSVELAEHKRALKTLHLLSKPLPYNGEITNGDSGGTKASKKHHPEKWRRLGFESENPAVEFEETGYLGLMDFMDYARRNVDPYQKILMEQSVNRKDQRCPLVRASLSVTMVLYEHFQIHDSTGMPESLNRPGEGVGSDVDVDKIFRPFLLQWGRLHTAAFNAFMRMWQVSGAELDDYYKIEELVRIIVGRIVGSASRKTEIGKIEEDIRNVTLETARNWQMEGYEDVYEENWGPHLVQVREQLHHESLQFMKEQRIRCLLQGSWFPTGPSSTGRNGEWRYVRLSHNRRWLHYRDFNGKRREKPALDDLHDAIDLNTVTSVDSNMDISQSEPATAPLTNGVHNNDSTDTLTDTPARENSTTRISILGTPTGEANPSYDIDPDEVVLLELFPQNSHLASEWLDGLLMLLNQQPITKDTTKLVDMMEDWGVRLRMLNLRWDDVDWDALDYSVREEDAPPREVPSRDGLEGEEYWYAMPEN